MARYLGLTGRKLHAAVWIESWVAVSIFGYNGAGAGGVLNLPAFLQQFPSIDVTDAPESQKHNKSVIQGMHAILREGLKSKSADCRFDQQERSWRYTFCSVSLVRWDALSWATFEVDE